MLEAARGFAAPLPRAARSRKAASKKSLRSRHAQRRAMIGIKSSISEKARAVSGGWWAICLEKLALNKPVDLASNRAEGVVHVLSYGMPVQLNRMQAHGARGSLRADQDGMDQHGAGLESASQSNGPY
jgi:hypothetical protein